MNAPGGPHGAEESVGEGDPPRAAWAAQVATHRVIRGRRWRTSDPRIPEPLRQRLVDELMAARRAVRAALEDEDAHAERVARGRVHDAKVALGERGVRWWEESPAVDGLRDRVERAARALGAVVDGHGEHEVAAVTSRPVGEVVAVLEGEARG